ncbi:hypothetical protein [Photobacterium damselae]|uniref:hypothetical protein n=1 Tax=Photobacterium damselae TaxID=38293 RepID=UPI001F289B1A|nr:hypothetical protein [Photobacterium damselae]UKA04634.1 hypothetical protein IHC89_23735 [Photobacterium damselae subsp. damselae]
MSACSSRSELVGEHKSPLNTNHGVNTAQVIDKVSNISTKPFVTERAIPTNIAGEKKVNDDSTVKAMVGALTSELKEHQNVIDDKFHNSLIDIQKQYNNKLRSINVEEFENIKHAINIGIMKVEAEINQVQTANVIKCPNFKNQNVGSEKDDRNYSGEAESQYCNDVYDHIASLNNDLERFNLELQNNEAKESLSKLQERLKIEKWAVRARIAARKEYELKSTILKVDADTKTLLVERMHEVDSKFRTSIVSASDLVDSYTKQLDGLADYSDDEF